MSVKPEALSRRNVVLGIAASLLTLRARADGIPNAYERELMHLEYLLKNSNGNPLISDRLRDDVRAYIRAVRTGVLSKLAIDELRIELHIDIFLLYMGERGHV